MCPVRQVTSWNGHTLTVTSSLPVSFTAAQGWVRATNPACSVEPPAITKAREERQSSIDPTRRAVGGMR